MANRATRWDTDDVLVLLPIAFFFFFFFLFSFFFFKQKTAYEIRPRDWSSDVCSSDLFYYVIKNGSATVSRKPSTDSKEIKLAELGEGDADRKSVV